jgi:peroxiredoxin
VRPLLAIGLAGALVTAATIACAQPKPRPVRRVKATGAKKTLDEGQPWLGIGIEPGKRGVRVNQVIDGAPAHRAGLAIGDEVLTIDGRSVVSPDELISRIGGFKIGRKVKLEIARRGVTRIVSVVLAARLDDQEVLERRLLDKPAPAFEAHRVQQDPDAKATTVSLASLRGKVVIIEFLATWCGPCKSTYPTLGELQARRRGDGLVVLGISEESDAGLRALDDQEKLGFALLRDVGAAARGAFHKGMSRMVTPTLFVIDRAGVVRFVGMGAGITVDHAVFAAERALGEKDE